MVVCCLGVRDKFMTFQEQLTITLIDKVFIGALLLVAGLWLNKELETFKSRQTKSLEIAKEKRQQLERQLSEFYRPILLRLERDNVVWEHMLDKYKNDPAKRKFGLSFERTFILPNHDQIIGIIETHGHLVGNDGEVLEEINNYTRHVAVYKALRAMGDETDPYNLDKDLGWPYKFYEVIKARTSALEQDYYSLLDI
jgi:hypothetical protein